MSDAKEYAGGCHCGKVRFQATMALGKVMECNCSICSRVAALRTFMPASRLKLSSGADALTDYQFGKQHLPLLFCKVCGVHSFASGTGPDGVEMRAIHVRCLDGRDGNRREVAHFDGKSR